MKRHIMLYRDQIRSVQVINGDGFSACRPTTALMKALTDFLRRNTFLRWSVLHTPASLIRLLTRMLSLTVRDCS